MYSTYNEAKSVITERFIKTLNAKIYKKWQLVITKSYLSYLNELVDQYNNTYHHGIKKKAINADYSALNEQIETNLKVPIFKVNDRVKITNYKNIISKDYTVNWSREIFFINSDLKTYPWTWIIIQNQRVILEIKSKQYYTCQEKIRPHYRRWYILYSC